MIRKAAGAILMALAVAACNANAPGQAPSEPLRSVRYSSGGGMQGGHSSIELKLDDTGAAIVETREQTWHNSRETTCTYSAPADIFEQVNRIVAEYGLVTASTRPESEFFPLDGDLWTLSFDYGKESFSIGQLQETSERESEGVSLVLKELRKCCAQDPLSTSLSPRKLRLSTTEGYTFFFEIEDSALADALVAQLPAKAALEPYSTNELVFKLDEKLDAGDAAPAPGGGAGTLAYYEPQESVVIFIDDYEPAEGLYLLGSFDAWDAQYLAEHAGKSCTLVLDTME